MMKHKLSLFLVVAAGSLALSVAAYADDSTPSPVDPGHPRVTEVQKRQANQQERIQNGVQSGALTPKEAARLEQNQARIEQHKEAAMAKHNGRLTKAEQQSLNRQENRASARIYHAKHNAKKAPPAAAAPTTK